MYAQAVGNHQLSRGSSTYLRSWCESPMPLPSPPRRYTTTPRPAAATWPRFPLPVLIPKQLGLGYNKTGQHLCFAF
jgi:hypothetical protein